MQRVDSDLTLCAKGGKLSGGSATEEAIESSRSVLGHNRAGNTTGLQSYFVTAETARFVARVFGRDSIAFDPASAL